jgi:hypothetical protein
MFLDCIGLDLAFKVCFSTALTSTGGSIATRDFGSTGCPVFNPSSVSVDMLESDLTRLAIVVCVSAL